MLQEVYRIKAESCDWGLVNFGGEIVKSETRSHWLREYPLYILYALSTSHYLGIRFNNFYFVLDTGILYYSLSETKS